MMTLWLDSAHWASPQICMGDWERGVVSAHSFANDEQWAPDWHQLALADCVAASIAHFVS